MEATARTAEMSGANGLEKAAIEAGYVVTRKASEAKATRIIATGAAAVDKALALEASKRVVEPV